MTDRDFYRENGYLQARGVFDASDVEAMRVCEQYWQRRPRFELEAA